MNLNGAMRLAILLIVVECFSSIPSVSAQSSAPDGPMRETMRAAIRRRIQQQIEQARKAKENAKFWSGNGVMKLRESTSEGGVKRKFYLYTPVRAKQSEALPLVLVFHGGGGTAEGTDRSTGGITALADEKNFLVAFPDGIDHHWSDGRKQLVGHVDNDLAWISKTIDALASEGIADKNRVYATGISNGGFFSQYLALKIPGKIAAVASVAASVPEEYLNLKEGKPVPILFILGSKDPLIPAAGGQVGGRLLPGERGKVVSKDDSLAFWLAHNKNKAKGEPLNCAAPDSTMTVKSVGYGRGTNEVMLVYIEGGGHTWPRGAQYLPAKIVGPVCGEFSGNEVIWNFFSKHRLSE